MLEVHPILYVRIIKFTTTKSRQILVCRVTKSIGLMSESKFHQFQTISTKKMKCGLDDKFCLYHITRHYLPRDCNSDIVQKQTQTATRGMKHLQQICQC
jgi:hypothetical protein